tara:strand:+ start:13807 stop:14727 length:921 start_codon:yes stop_codon:yes gene_type:complete
MTVPFIATGDKIVIHLEGKVKTFQKEDKAYHDVIRLMSERASEEEIVEVLKGFESIEEYVLFSGNSKVNYRNGKVFIEGEELHHRIVERINDFRQQGLPIEPILAFIENIQENPSYGAQQELYDFLEHKDLALTEDGYFLAYKAVRSNLTDKRTGTFDNSPGRRVSMQRARVDDDRRHSCSNGLHVGAIGYVNSFGYGEDKVVIVKVNPKDVVSVPLDSSCQKCRVCEYVVLREFDHVFEKPLYDTEGHNAYSWETDDENFDFSSDEEYEDDLYNEGDIVSTWDDDEYEDEDEDDSPPPFPSHFFN